MSGRGTSAGIIFQSEVAAYIAALLLSKRPLSRLDNMLPGKPLKIFLETPLPVDDVNILTEDGCIYFQVKTNISLSNNDINLYSVVEQFVLQYLEGVKHGDSYRKMDVNYDMMVLVVSHIAPTTIRIDLKDILDKNRSNSATGISERQQKAFNIFKNLIGKSWLKKTGKEILSHEENELLKLCSVVILDESKKQSGIEMLSHVVENEGDEITLWSILITWASEASRCGTGGDNDTIRKYLKNKIILASPISYKDDIKKLKVYSENVVLRLADSTKIITDEGEIKLTRSISQVVLNAAKKNSFVVVGEPGSGKSGIMKNLADTLKQKFFVLTLIVEPHITSLDELKNEIGLKHSLIEILKNISTNSINYLILDALDASRGGLAEAVYRKLILDMFSVQNWIIVASVRTFDLELGIEWRKLFKGKIPNLNYSDKKFGNICHVKVPLLEPAELDEVQKQSPLLKSALKAGGNKIAPLAKNLFNLSLICDLIKNGAGPESLGGVDTRAELISRYWEERVEYIGLQGRIHAKMFVDQLLSDRNLDVIETKIPSTAAIDIEKLLLNGVLKRGQTNRIGFRHHVLFDYAVSKLILEPSVENSISILSSGADNGILLAPSLEYWLAELQKNNTIDVYWKSVALILSNDKTDPIIKVEIGRISVMNVSSVNNLKYLARLLSDRDNSYKKAIFHFAGTISTFGIDKSKIGIWSSFVANLANLQDNYQLSSVRNIIDYLIKYNDDSDNTNLGIAARNLFDIVSENERLIPWLSRDVITNVTKTFSTNLSESRYRLEKIFEKERFEKFGYIEIPKLAMEVLSFAAYDNDLLTKLFYTAFTYEGFDNNQQTSLGGSSWILNFVSNAAQDFSSARHILETKFSDLLNITPSGAVQALAASFLYRSKYEEKKVAFLNNYNFFIEDHSGYNSWDLDTNYGSVRSKIYHTYLSWLSICKEDFIEEIPDLILNKNKTAIAWRILFESGSRHPKIGKMMLNSAIDPVILVSISTRKFAINMIANTYCNLSNKERDEIENRVMAYDFLDTADPILKEIIITKLFNTIGISNLVTNEAKDLLLNTNIKKDDLLNDDQFEIIVNQNIHVESGRKPNESEEIEKILKLKDLINVFLNNDKKLQDYNDLHILLKKLLDEIKKVSVPEDIDRNISSTTAQALGKILKYSIISEEDQNIYINELLKLANHTHPVSNINNESSFNDFPVWDPDSPRVESADSIGNLMDKREFFDQFIICYEHLLNDKHPAVRMKAALYLPHLYKSDKNVFWDIVQNFISSEKNKSVLAYAAKALFYSPKDESYKMESIFIKLVEKNATHKFVGNVAPVKIAFFAFYENYNASKELLNNYIKDFEKNENFICTVISACRSYLAPEKLGESHKEAECRNNFITFLCSLIEVLKPHLNLWPLDVEPSSKDISALKLLNEISDQLYYAVILDNPINDLTADEKWEFIEKYKILISNLSRFGSPKTVHYCLQILEQLIETNPEYCFDLFSEALLRKEGVAKYENEPLGAELFITIVGIYLTDYRSIFEDKNRRQKLIDCLTIFLEAGWPEARRLFAALKDLR